MAAMSTNGESTVMPLAKSVTTLTLTPNPAASQVILQYGDPGTMFDVKITNISGAAVLSVPHLISGQPVNVSNLKTGIYFIHVNTGKEAVTKKLIKR
jgi:hypothetical protein